MLWAGRVYRSTLTVKAQSGAPSTVTLAITKPDGTLVSPAPTPGAGSQVGADWVVTYDYTLPSAGRFVFTWATTGPGTAPYPDVVNVRAAASIVGLGEVKAHLNITGTSSDDELAAFLQPDTAAGIVRLPDGATFWGGPWDVVYEAGRAVMPERFLQACKEQVR